VLQKILSKLPQNPRGKRPQVLLGDHDAQVYCRSDRKQIQRLIQQFSMLTRDYDALLYAPSEPQTTNHWGQFDGFRACP